MSGSARRLFQRLLSSLRPGRAEAELERELASHLRMLEDEFARRGLGAGDGRTTHCAAAASRRQT